MNKVKNIFANTGCIPEEVLTNYISNKLAPAEKHVVERHLIDCEMCSDAVEGLSAWTSGSIPSPKQPVTDEKKISEVTLELNKKITNRLGKKEAKVIFLIQYRTQLTLAASLIILLGLVFFFRNNTSINELGTKSADKIIADKFEPPPSEIAKPHSLSPGIPEEQKKWEKNSKETSKEKNQNKRPVSPENPAEEKQVKIQSEISSENHVNGITEVEPPVQSQEENNTVETKDVLQNKSEEKVEPAPTSSVNAVIVSKYSQPNMKKETTSEKRKEDWNKVSTDKAAKPLQEQARPAEDNILELALTPTASPSQENRHEEFAMDSVSLAVTLNTAMHKYERKDYSGAVKDFEQLLKLNPTNEKALFYSAVSYLNLGQPKKAIANLNSVRHNKQSEYYDDAQWYLSLAYIKNNDKKNAKKNLLQIQNNPRSKYQEQADEMLKEIEK